MRKVLFVLIALVGCTAGEETPQAPEVAATDPTEEARRMLEENLQRIDTLVQEMDDALQPVPYLTIAQKRALQRYRNPQQVARARQLGVSGASTDADLERLTREGRLVRLADTTQYWVVRDMTASRPYVTPDVQALLEEIGERFQARLAERYALPPLRFEITSALRTAESQAGLRESNDNAARNSAHLYGTTVDIAYNGFAVPAEPITELDVRDAPWLAPFLQRYADAAVQMVAGRRSGEIQAILGSVLRELQNEGKVMVTYEEQQPVFHMTVNQRY